jgi:hypothetical protein
MNLESLQQCLARDLIEHPALETVAFRSTLRNLFGPNILAFDLPTFGECETTRVSDATNAHMLFTGLKLDAALTDVDAPTLAWTAAGAGLLLAPVERPIQAWRLPLPVFVHAGSALSLVLRANDHPADPRARAVRVSLLGYEFTWALLPLLRKAETAHLLRVVGPKL